MKNQKMDASRRLLLGILDEMGEPVEGRTMMQKIIFILRHRFGKFRDYKYSLHYYGPYSEDLTDELRHLKYQGLIEENVVPVNEVMRFDIELTPEGRKIARENKDVIRRSELSKMVSEAVDLNHTRLKDVIDEAYQIAAQHGLD